MSDKPIGAGDLVAAVRCCCVRSSKPIGIPFEVTGIVNDGRPAWCQFCNGHFPGAIAKGLPGWMLPVAWLKRFDAPAQPEAVDHDEEIMA